jgi:hypothetical protein
MIKSQYLHPNISYCASQASGRKKKKKEQQGVQQVGSQSGLLNDEEIPSGDQDSGIVDAYANVPDDGNVRQRTRGKKVYLRMRRSDGKTRLLKNSSLIIQLNI